ncbi:MAG: DUF6055 domain-containing protein [Bacteroidota bacterium]|nr:DUF6055 domain-containing protein [Bacteroidota bacterium]
MKRFLLPLIYSLMSVLAVNAQDSLYFKANDRFQPNRSLFSTVGLDSVEVLARGTTPVFRRYSPDYTNGYADFRAIGLTALDGTSLGSVTFGYPGRILWKPLTSDANYNNDYNNPDSRWNFTRSRESEHWVVFWDREFGADPLNAPSAIDKNGYTVDMRVDIDDMLIKAEQFYDTNVDSLHMAYTGEGKSQLDTYKAAIYLIYTTEWTAYGGGNDYKVGTLWVNPSTCHPIGHTIAHEIGHSFQYQTYCDHLLNGGADNKQSGFQYGLPGSNGGNGFWEQCAQWQAFQNYLSQTLSAYDVNVWIANHHRHFEHEWQRYASYWEQFYWTETKGRTALGRIWNESHYPEDGNQAYMRIFLNNNYDTLKHELFAYAQKATTFDFAQVRRYASMTTSDRYTFSPLSIGDGWYQVSYAECVQPTGFNVIKLAVPTAGTQVTFHMKGLPVGSALASGDAGIQVNGDGKTIGTTTNYNTTAVAGHEGWAYGFVAYQRDGSRVYGDMNLLSTTNAEVTATFTVPAETFRLFVVVQGTPNEYRQCPWDEKESTDDQLPYQFKIEGTTLK